MSRSRIALPAVVQPQQPHGFPLLATLAPVVVSVLIWLVTRSPFALMFAALGPAVAIASVADAGVQSRRHLRRERARFASELASAHAEVAAFHETERRERDLDAPTAAARLGRGDHDPERWSTGTAAAVLTLGRGASDSTIGLDAPTARGEGAEQLRELEARARRLHDAPVTVAARLGVAVVGPAALTAPVARGLVLQLAALIPPALSSLVLDALPPEGHWLRELPHRLVVDPALHRGELVFRDADGDALIAVGATVDAAPSRARVVMRVGATPAIERHPERAACGPLAVEYVAREQALAWAARLGALIAADPAVLLPEVVPLAALLPDGARDGERAREGAARTLAAPIGVGAEGPRVVDLVADGPHAVVGGTTGSGKSELLVAWVLALAAAYPPSRVTFLLVDFKGGASFAPIEHIPHCVGVLSDLDERAALRALESLRAEVRYRERALAAARVRTIDELEGALPRLVIVVDEFAAMVGDYPDLHTLFADLAARGRSLGLHLVLCTQRPAGAVRDAVLANAGLRISLRVNNAADSRAVIGTDAAAALSAAVIGRALVSVAGERPVEVQVPLAAEADADAITARWPGAAAQRRPWCPPLPAVLEASALEAAAPAAPALELSRATRAYGIRLGLADHPHEQAQPVVAWSPVDDGHLLVVGGSRSGKTGVLRAVAAGAAEARRVPADAERAWDVVLAARAAIRSGGAGGGAGAVRLLLLDDLDALLSRFPDEYADGYVAALAAVLREGPAAGTHVVLTTQRLTPSLHRIVALCEQRLLLRMPTRQDHVIAGGAGEGFDPAAPPGRGEWNGQSVQVVHERDQDLPEASTSPPVALQPPFAVVTASPRAFAERARARGASVVDVGKAASATGATIVVGDPDAWQANWGALQAVNQSLPVFFDGVGLADFRMLARSRTLPPIVTTPGAGWLLTPDGDVERALF